MNIDGRFRGGNNNGAGNAGRGNNGGGRNQIHWPPKLIITEEERLLLDHLSSPEVGILPSSLRCPITHELIIEPAVVNGHCFERLGITTWLTSHREDPVGRQPCSVRDLRPGMM